MPRPYFVSDQATVTVLKPVASSAFGSYKLSVPEDVDINDVHEFSAPGNELGYVASLAPKGMRVGGFARRFVRADVSVTAADTTDPDWVPSSDVDKVLTEAAARVEGDFFLESDITKAGLGPWIPFTHFEQGDLATVEIWGRRVPLPVTRIDPKVTDHDENDWSVHVGGQVLTDDEARLAENEMLRQAAVQSRREVAGLESQTAKAVSTADSANAKSDQALKAATDADGTIQSKLDEQRQLSSEFSSNVARAESAADKASQAFDSVDGLINSPDGEFRRGVSDALAAQDSVNRSQQEVNATQSNINRQQGEINTALSKATTAAQQTARDAKAAAGSAQTASEKALQASVDVVKSQQLLEDTQLVQGNAIFWQEVHRTRVFYKYSMVTTDTYGGVMTITPIDSQRKMQMDFAGNWGGRVLVEARMADAWGNNSRVDFFSYGVMPGNRRLIVEPEVINYGVNRMHITIEQWWPNAAMEFVFLPNGSGGWQKPPYEDSIYGGVSNTWLSKGIMTVWWVRSKPYVATRDVMASPDDGATWQMYRAGSMLPKTGASDGFSFTSFKPVSGESRPVQLVEQL